MVQSSAFFDVLNSHDRYLTFYELGNTLSRLSVIPYLVCCKVVIMVEIRAGSECASFLGREIKKM